MDDDLDHLHRKAAREPVHRRLQQGREHDGGVLVLVAGGHDRHGDAADRRIAQGDGHDGAEDVTHHLRGPPARRRLEAEDPAEARAGMLAGDVLRDPARKRVAQVRFLLPRERRDGDPPPGERPDERAGRGEVIVREGGDDEQVHRFGLGDRRQVAAVEFDAPGAGGMLHREGVEEFHGRASNVGDSARWISPEWSGRGRPAGARG
ncbi:MAG TPA: hypothetical protein VFR81_23765 [Longimicrobium sp.]|nr:hypothetical protein [Longimicrobium sp.]